MKPIHILSVALLSGITLFSCKNDVEATKESTIESTKETTTETSVETQINKKEVTPKKNLTEKEIALKNSLMAKVMMNSEIKNFTRAMVSAGLIDGLSNAEKEYTIFAPVDPAFNVFGKGQNIMTDPTRKEELTNMLNNHIVVGTIDSATLLQNIKQNGSQQLTSRSGKKIKATLVNNDIVLTFGETKATLGKSDYKGSNGVLHLIDTVLQ